MFAYVLDYISFKQNWCYGRLDNVQLWYAIHCCCDYSAHIQVLRWTGSRSCRHSWWLGSDDCPESERPHAPHPRPRSSHGVLALLRRHPIPCCEDSAWEPYVARTLHLKHLKSNLCPWNRASYQIPTCVDTVMDTEHLMDCISMRSLTTSHQGLWVYSLHRFHSY